MQINDIKVTTTMYELRGRHFKSKRGAQETLLREIGGNVSDLLNMSGNQSHQFVNNLCGRNKHVRKQLSEKFEALSELLALEIDE